ncbi:MAG: dihydropteroate synthase [Kiloniellales bacterium]
MIRRLTLRPLGIGAAVEAAGGLSLAGGPLGFTACECVVRDHAVQLTRQVVPVSEIPDWATQFGPDAAAEAVDLLQRLSAPRGSFAGLELTRPRVMGVINVTPDSFSDGGERFDGAKAIADGFALWEAGAEILDVGGESTRPGAEPIDRDEELRRVVPVVRGLADRGALVSIDTRHARVMEQAISAGAKIVNDVTALAGDPRSLMLAARAEVSVILMHMQGQPQSMQCAPIYDDAPLDVYDHLGRRIAACAAAGIALDRIAVDPGIGFGKTVDHNLQILDQMALYQGFGCAVALGVSRKSFIGRLSRGEPPKARIPGSIAAALTGLERGVQIIRAHDVAETVQALAVWQAVNGPRNLSGSNLLP